MAKTSIPKSTPKAKDLLNWYARNARPLPWRRHEGRGDTPYHTWLSEIMLQQTTVATVIPYYMKFIERWPTVKALASAEDDAVMQAWAGLGYYSRARNVLACARIVAQDHKGIFPNSLEALKALPGIGDYTANAIRAIAFDLPANVVDGNVERVVARIFNYDKSIRIPVHKKELKALAAQLAPDTNAGDYAQALMDLGATICTPRQPQCPVCPWRKSCRAFAQGTVDQVPVIERMKKQPMRSASFFIPYDSKGRIFLYKRPPTGLLGGLWAFPATAWDNKTPETPSQEKKRYPAALSACVAIPQSVTHVFSHFKLSARVYLVPKSKIKTALPEDGLWFKPQDMPELPSLMQKIWHTGRTAFDGHI